ncbi:MAG TPA: MFS transporter [Acetobacteraceae bacterium]|jgi:MFS family permease|nr:MFS transporter [Acetobacteraceae bacterium]
MASNARRGYIYGLLFTLLMISMLDRINMSVAGSSIAKEMDLSPTALGYLFSSFLWIYVICLLPWGAVTDWLGTRRTIGGAVILWSIAQMCSGLAPTLTTLFLSRLGLGIGESAVNPGANSVIREWAPRQERGLASAIWISGSLAGPMIGAVLVSWLVANFGWRLSFVITAGIGLLWAAIWWLVFRRPEETRWLSPAERQKILSERAVSEHAVERPTAGPSVGYRGLLSSPTMWGLAFTQGCMTYTAYFFLTWLPGYMQMSRGFSIMQSGIYTALPYGFAIIFCVAFSYISDRLLDRSTQHSGARRNAVAFGNLATATVLLIPFAGSINVVVALLTTGLTFSGASQSWNFALTNDLLRENNDVGRAFAFLTLGGNSFGILAPIVTGYLVSSTGSFTIPFIICGVLAVLGSITSLLATRGTIGGEQPDRLAPATASA